VLRLPHILALIQKDLFKLTIWSQIGVQGAEIRSTEESISAALHTISDLVDSLDDEHSSEALETNIRRYGNAVAQALILIKRSPAVGATATRGMEQVYLDAESAVAALAEAAHAQFDQGLQSRLESWRGSAVRFLLMIGGVALLVPAFAIGSDRLIARPVKQLAQVVDSFRGGRLDVRIPWTTRRDEIGLVARAIESFRQSLIRNQELEREREQLNQDLERKVEERTQELAEQKERLAIALDKEHKLNGLQRQFVSMVCHEFRTPLAIIDANAQRVIKRHETMAPERMVAALGKVRTSVTRLTNLMESVLSASRLEAGTIKMEPAPCDLAEMINEVASNYREVHPDAEITVETSALPPRFSADVNLLRQVISNLVSNAVKYSPDGASVRNSAAALGDGGVEIAVQDGGLGIPAAERDKLFERFFRASTSTGIAGTGIGLHMVKAIVDMHRGRIEVASEEGVGTTFTVYLPRSQDKSAADQEAISQVA
jgi:signal transduction histidine kinase